MSSENQFIPKSECEVASLDVITESAARLRLMWRGLPGNGLPMTVIAGLFTVVAAVAPWALSVGLGSRATAHAPDAPPAKRGITVELHSGRRRETLSVCSVPAARSHCAISTHLEPGPAQFIACGEGGWVQIEARGRRWWAFGAYVEGAPCDALPVVALDRAQVYADRALTKRTRRVLTSKHDARVARQISEDVIELFDANGRAGYAWRNAFGAAYEPPPREALR